MSSLGSETESSSSWLLTPEDIIEYTKDKSELNILLQGEVQSSPKLIALCMKLAISTFNGVIPISFYNETNFPSAAILLYGTLHHLAVGEVERQLRNQVDFNAQGLNVALDNKATIYQQLSQYYRGLFDSETKALKAYLNTEQAWGESYSPYARINDFIFRN